MLMKKYILSLFIIIACFMANATTYYVSLTGSNGNSGLTEALAWRTLTYAVGGSSPVVAGDLIYVKCGNYGNENVVFSKEGSCGLPLTVRGYKTTPGESITALINQANPYTAYTTTAMPTYTGSSRTTGIAIDTRDRDYINIENIQITAYAYGLLSGSADTTANINLYNVNCMTIGDPSNTYLGQGILYGSMGTQWGDRNKIVNCLVVNCCAEGVNFNGDNNVAYGCKVYCNEQNTIGYEQTDYYFMCCGNYNRLDHCYGERAAAVAAAGSQSIHGFSFKTNAEQVIDQGLPYPTISAKYNVAYYCGMRNADEGFCARHRLAQYNLFSHCYARGTHTGSSAASGNGNLITWRDGASYNTADACNGDSLYSFYEIYDTSEDGGSHPGTGNKIINSWGANCYATNYFNNPSGSSTYTVDCGQHLVANCSFYLTRYLHICSTHCANMIFQGNIYYGNSDVGSGGYFAGGTYSADITAGEFTDCDYYKQQGGVSAPILASTGSKTVTPSYTNAAARNFILGGSSAMLNANSHITAETVPIVAMCQFATPNNNLDDFDRNVYNVRNIPHITRNYDGVVKFGARNIGCY